MTWTYLWFTVCISYITEYNIQFHLWRKLFAELVRLEYAPQAREVPHPDEITPWNLWGRVLRGRCVQLPSRRVSCLCLCLSLCLRHSHAHDLLDPALPPRGGAEALSFNPKTQIASNKDSLAMACRYDPVLRWRTQTGAILPLSVDIFLTTPVCHKRADLYLTQQ